MTGTAYCFDLDGTLTSLEILPCIAAELGVADEIATLTRLTMDGIVPFEDSMRLRTLILGQIPIERIHAIISAIPLNHSLLEFIREHHDRCFIVTGNIDLWINPLLCELGCRSFCSHAGFVDNILRLSSVLSKGYAIEQIRNPGKFDKIVAVGDGSNDVSMLNAADIGIAYSGVHDAAASAIEASNLIVYEAETLCNLLKEL